MVVHDLNLAIQYSDEVAALNQGQLAQFGAPKEIITTQLIQDIFEVESEIIPMNDYPIVIVKAA
ncbi:putative siderophore transport system ATP-binding protein YusV [Photobacterium damselae subsp. piscicida]|uniref:Siderophore transport system ATP-binding protein YusV n=1 Tax=Photobacterium damsela subsp. piscicida TaxID=38294 RepID=A0A1V1VE89_PHODP|nr:ABC transporter ATP-binding protein [Photobacterium damselae]MBE8126979.1 hypothetical protein [Photobacterium damselae subsp. piscicida]MDP2513719.1 ABC transporter ATP-binding protein [Photobacterium damselae subsp. piscicida]MDP2531679.1 ABC transporter ATP-binding protein [Photobacterium damselae subsp. piscicida]MDP2543154.1 ABC transporter ATP-binding protein [Photobacterium damselae subsp. piscicida]MDP2558149.1 ABC transporter ATP-binding protein [Photobacterium damselae subsp. pisc